MTDPGPTHPARYWQQVADGRLQCDLCPRFCRLRDTQQGLCFVRQRTGDRIVLTTYGRSSGFCIDPIEKKPLNHFLPGTPVLSFGTAGCNLTCRFCQNWDISKSREVNTLAAIATPDTIARAASELECASVAFTYNDPVIFLEYAVDVAVACHAHGIATVAVTAGEICSKPRQEFFASMNAANIDLKAFDPDFYRDMCGGDLATVLETLSYVYHETDTWLEITTLLIPDANDSDAQIEAQCKWIVDNLGAEIPLHFSAFHPDYRLHDRPPTPASTLTRARRIALDQGMFHVYTGNIHDEEGGSTSCAECGQTLIGRDWYTLTTWGLNDEGACRNCGTALVGVFRGPPGRWGARRQPITLGQFVKG